MDGASKATLENEFGTHVDDEVIKQILEKGTIQETQVRSLYFITFSPPWYPNHSIKQMLTTFSLQAGERQGSTNDSMGARVAH